VSFTYNDTKIEALKNISFTIKKGETIAILGKTGSEKSSVLNFKTLRHYNWSHQNRSK
jgi:ATP-binding cassette subfamily B protein